MNPSTALARVVVDELFRAGVRDVVLSPGSRSAPLALALAAAEAEGRLHLHVRTDERSAAYLALGLAEVAGRQPAAVVTTSGTAAVNLHPAVTEASFAGLPLVCVTADRPPSLRATGANQTVEQVGVFGRDARWVVELSSGETGAGHVRHWRASVARAVARATDMIDPGPVHIDVGLADPLLPDGDDTWPEPLAGRPGDLPWTSDGRTAVGMAVPVEQAVSLAIGRTAIPARGLIVVGDQHDDEAPELVGELSEATGWPVLSEPSGNARDAGLALAHGSLLCADEAFAEAHVPDLVLTVGRVGLTRSVLRLVARAPMHLAVDPRPADRWADPTRTAVAVLDQVPLPPEDDVDVDEGWTRDWLAADAAAAAAVDRLLAAREALSGPAVAREVVSAVPADGLLVLGASWPVRHVEAFAPGDLDWPLVVGNRGTSGIDGVVSTAWGAALRAQRPGPRLGDLFGDDGLDELNAAAAASGRPSVDPDTRLRGGPAVALLGDLTFLYDSNGLLAPRDEPQPDLTYVVVDNDGGGIFSSLEQGRPEHAAHFERVFGTPHGRDLRAVARASGVPAVAVTTQRRLREELAARVREGAGVSVVVVRVGRRDAEAALLRELQAAVGAALLDARR